MVEALWGRLSRTVAPPPPILMSPTIPVHSLLAYEPVAQPAQSTVTCQILIRHHAAKFLSATNLPCLPPTSNLRMDLIIAWLTPFLMDPLVFLHSWRGHSYTGTLPISAICILCLRLFPLHCFALRLILQCSPQFPPVKFNLELQRYSSDTMGPASTLTSLP